MQPLVEEEHQNKHKENIKCALFIEEWHYCSTVPVLGSLAPIDIFLGVCSPLHPSSSSVKMMEMNRALGIGSIWINVVPTNM